MSQTIRLLIADDHPVVRDGLRGIFEASGEFEVAGEAANGREAVLSPSVATGLLGQVRQPAREPLSQRELDILGLIAQGCSNREAATRLFISEATVKTHVLHIYAKLGVNDRAAAVAAGFERGLLPRP